MVNESSLALHMRMAVSDHMTKIVFARKRATKKEIEEGAHEVKPNVDAKTHPNVVPPFIAIPDLALGSAVFEVFTPMWPNICISTSCQAERKQTVKHTNPCFLLYFICSGRWLRLW